MQRAAIAQALGLGAETLFLDEPFSAIDVEGRNKIQDLLLDLTKEQKLGIVMVTHDMDEAVYLSDAIYILSRPTGTTSNLFLWSRSSNGLARTQAIKGGNISENQLVTSNI